MTKEAKELLEAAIWVRAELSSLPFELLENRPDLSNAERRLDLAIEAAVDAAS